MILHLFDWLIIAGFLLLSLFIGLYFRKQASKSLTDFFLGGRSLGWFVAGTSMVATTFAADTPLAVTELVGQNGISGNWLWWNFLLGGMLTTFFFARLWRKAGVLTEVELIELRYGGKPAALLRGFKSVYLGLFMNCLIIGWVNVALISILKVFFGVDDTTAIWIVAAVMLLTAVYSSISGLLGVAFTDVIQFILAMTGCIILAVLVVNSDQVGGITGLKEKLPSWSLDFFPTIGDAGSANGVAGALTIGIGTFLAYTTVQWWASWYPGAEPGGGGYIAQRMMSAKDEKNAIFATLYFQIAHYCLRPWPWILVGLSAMVLYPDLEFADKKLGYVMAMKDFLPVGLRGMLLAAFLAAYMSTISTQLNWGAGYLVNDFYKRFIPSENKEKDNDKQLILASRVATLLLMAIGLFATTQITTISGVWSFIIECGAGLGLVLILRWYWWRINAWSEITATVVPFIVYAAAKFVFDLQFPQSFFLTVGVTTASWLIVTFITSPERDETLIHFYRKVTPGGAWGPVRIQSGIEGTQQNIGTLLGCWLSAVVFTYSILFLTGKVIFGEWSSALLWFGLALTSFISLRFFISKGGIFNS